MRLRNPNPPLKVNRLAALSSGYAEEIQALQRRMQAASMSGNITLGHHPLDRPEHKHRGVVKSRGKACCDALLGNVLCQLQSEHDLEYLSPRTSGHIPACLDSTTDQKSK